MAVEAHRASTLPRDVGCHRRVLVNAPTNWLGSLSGAKPYAGAAFLDETTLAALGPDGLDLWDLGARTIADTVDVPAEPGQLAISDDRSRLAVGHQDGTWEVFDTDTFTVVERGDISSTVFAIALDAGGNRARSVVSTASRPSQTSQVRRPIGSSARGNRIEDFAFTARGKSARGRNGKYGTVVVFDATTGEPVGPNISVEGGADVVAWSGQGLFVAMRHSASVFDAVAGQPVREGLRLQGTYNVVGRGQAVDGAVVLLSSEAIVERLPAAGDQVEVVGADPADRRHPDRRDRPHRGGRRRGGERRHLALLDRWARHPCRSHAGHHGDRGRPERRRLDRRDVPTVLGRAVGHVAHQRRRYQETLHPYGSAVNAGDAMYLIGWSAGESPTVNARALWRDGKVEPITAGPNVPSLTAMLSPDGATLVVDNGQDETDGMVTVIDRSSDEVITRLDAIHRDDDVNGNLQLRG